MDIKGPILRRLYVPQRLRVLCDESCPYCGDSVIIIAIIFIIIIIISISILSLLQKKHQSRNCGFKFEKNTVQIKQLFIYSISQVSQQSVSIF